MGTIAGTQQSTSGSTASAGAAAAAAIVHATAPATHNVPAHAAIDDSGTVAAPQSVVGGDGGVSPETVGPSPNNHHQVSAAGEVGYMHIS